MSRHVTLLLSCCLGVWATAGCSNLAERRVVDAFMRDLQKKDLAGLREITSADFENKALNTGKPWPVLEQMEFPDGKTNVVKVEDSTDTDKNQIKQVTVEVGKSKRKVLYRLKRESSSQKWVVDDVYLDPKNLEEDKSVASQLHIQLSVADFVETWRTEDRSRILASVTSEFKQPLSELPDERLAMLARSLVSDVPPESMPTNVELIEDKATAKMPRPKGDLIINLRRHDGHWLAEDISINSRDAESISSVRELAAVTTAAMTFYKAYQSSDKRLLERVTAPDFFKGTLELADFSQMKLPLPEPGTRDFEAKLEGPAAEVLVRGSDQLLKISLSPKKPLTSKEPPQYLVREVTLFDLKSNQDVRMSSLFNGQAIMQVFCDAFQQGDLKSMRSLCTVDFNRRVWNKVSPAILTRLPLDELERVEPRIESSVYRGSLTRINVTQGKTPLTYVLRDTGKGTLLDDIEVPTLDRQITLKMRLELMVPIVEFAEGFRQSSLDLLRANSSRDFSRIVWNHIRTIPKLEVTPNQFLNRPLNKVVLVSEGALVIFGDDQFGAKVFLQRQGEEFRVDDVTLISGADPSQRMQLLQIMRTRIARGDDVLNSSGPQANAANARSSTPPLDEDDTLTPANLR